MPYSNDGTGRDSYITRPPPTIKPNFTPPFLLERMAKTQTEPVNVLTHEKIPLSMRSKGGANRYNERSPVRNLDVSPLSPEAHKLPPYRHPQLSPMQTHSPGNSSEGMSPQQPFSPTESSPSFQYSPPTGGPSQRFQTTSQRNATKAVFAPVLRMSTVPPGYGGHRRGDVACYTSY